MRTVVQVLSFAGRLERLHFLALLAACGLAYLATTNALFAALPALAALTGPMGVNAGFVLNGLWLVCGLLCGWTVLAVTAARLRSAGSFPILASGMIPGIVFLEAWMLPLVGPSILQRLLTPLGNEYLRVGLIALSTIAALAVLSLCLVLQAKRDPRAL